MRQIQSDLQVTAGLDSLTGAPQSTSQARVGAGQLKLRLSGL